MREVGRELGLPAELLDRHPFPGPGLAIRCLCSEFDAPMSRPSPKAGIVPVHSVGVQGDSRSYAPGAGHRRARTTRRATELINRLSGVNRVVARVRNARAARGNAGARLLADRRAPRAPAARRRHRPAALARKRLRPPDLAVPGDPDSAGHGRAPDSVVLRPVDSVDGMTAQSVVMQPDLLDAISSELVSVPGVSGVFYDLTNKPPATIEWE